MELRALRYFVAIAELGSFSSASRMLHVAQPALSRQIRNLERELGVPLFHRTARGLLLSEGGAQLLDDGRHILDSVEQATARVRQNGASKREHVSVAITPSASMILTVPLFENVEHSKPSISLNVVESTVGNGAEWLDWIRERHLDLAIMYDVAKPPELRSESILTEELCLVGKSGRQIGAQVGFDTLGQYPLVLPTSIHPLRQIVDRAALRAGVSLRIVEESNSVPEVKWMVRQGKVFSILAPCAVWQERRHKQLFASRIVRPSLPRQLNIIGLPASLRSPSVRSIVQEIKATMHQLVNAGNWNAKLVSA